MENREQSHKLIGKDDILSPASENQIESFVSNVGFGVPKDFLDFFKITDGFEGDIGENSYLVIWKIDDLIEANNDYCVEEFAPGIFLFGSDGGDMAYGLDYRDKNNVKYIEIPFIGMDCDEISFISDNFMSFLEKIPFE